MTRNTTESSRLAGGETTLPDPLAAYTRYGLYGLFMGVLLGFFALFTNPVPDPSFPWFSLPARFRVPFTQPRIEHWPVSYSVAIWLWIVGFPALFFEGYRRVTKLGPTAWLAGLPVVSMLTWTTYCRFFWPKLTPPSWNAPSYTFVCWLYCSTYDPLWSNLAYAIAIFGVVATILAYKNDRYGDFGLATFGVLALPLGLPALFEAYRRHMTPSGGQT
ncbi:hypothetical protein HWV07_11375 [Natronomonas salina]|uniref:hypothetical protein n=1 Tax=Natronomonas salina TaxID=1710540 RepID=UPI0015B46F50|nr:hypothetical protein [Natronomonas salina]QLD89598.1 hypothetical protein HWV07_11375 [Natronomonas salina]